MASKFLYFYAFIVLLLCGCHASKSEGNNTFSDINQELFEENIKENDTSISFSMNNLSKIEEESFPPVSGKYLMVSNLYYYISRNYSLKRIDMLTHDEENLHLGKVNDFAVSDDGKYLCIGQINEEWYNEWESSNEENLYSENPFLRYLVPKVYDVELKEYVPLYLESSNEEFNLNFLKDFGNEHMSTHIRYNSESRIFEIEYNIDSPVPQITMTYNPYSHIATVKNKLDKKNN